MDCSLITILIANYNNDNYLTSCLDSLINQTDENFKVIILDDFSVDNSISIIENYIKLDSRFKLYKNDRNYGVGFTKSKLIHLADTDLCAFLDPDDAITNNAIKIMKCYHKKCPDVGLIYSNYFICDNNLKIIKLHKNKSILPNQDFFFNLHGEISHFVSFKKHVYCKTNGIDKFLKIAEDQDLYLKIYEVSKVMYINENLYLYRTHDNGISQNLNKNRSLYWHWLVIINSAQRRNVNVEELFLTFFIPRNTYWKLRNLFFIRILIKLKILRLNE